MSPFKDRSLPIDIIIPVYRDTAALRRTLYRMLAISPSQKLFVAFGEADPEAEAMVEEAGAHWIRANGKGRARQMNAAAARASAPILLFLHADTTLPGNALESIAQAINAGAVGGAFSRRFDYSNWFFKVSCWLADWRGHWFGYFLGDQAMFVRRDIFEQLGGFKEWDHFEDLDFSRRMKRMGKTCLIKPGVISSGRRFVARGPIRQTLLDLRLTLRHLLQR